MPSGDGREGGEQRMGANILAWIEEAEEKQYHIVNHNDLVVSVFCWNLLIFVKEES